jgi:hypothetical protein
MYFYMKSKRGTSLRSYHEAAQEMEYKVNRSDDPKVLEQGNRIAHAAKVRSEAQLLAGATHWIPGKRWNADEAD